MSSKKQTPMMEQYQQIKDQYPDTFLFFRLGDFYEMFNEDAVEASKILEITLTSRNKKMDDPIPMCGVPYHSATDYVRRLIEAGHKVAICEQMEDPKAVKGMVRREVVQVVTPGTILEEGALQGKENHYLATVIAKDAQIVLAYTDLSTGELKLTTCPSLERLISELQAIKPHELVYASDFPALAADLLQAQLKTYYSVHEIKVSPSTLSDIWELEDSSASEAECLNLLVDYLLSVQKQTIHHLQPVVRYQLSEYMQLNNYAQTQLELKRSLRTQQKKGSLLWYLDRTKTAMGGRLLAQWLDKPLLNRQELTHRHQQVASLVDHYFDRLDLIDLLSGVYDLERLVTRISLGHASARDIDQLRSSLELVPVLNAVLQRMNADTREETGVDHFQALDEHRELYDLIDRILVNDPPISVTEGQIIRSGYHTDLDKYREALDHGQEWLIALQERERQRTGLKSLKVGYNKVFGYYIEVSRLQAEQLDDKSYHRKQTLANTERFITEELKDIETVILEAQDKSELLEYELFVELRQQIAPFTASLQGLAHQIASLDVLSNFAQLSEQEGYVRAELSDQPRAAYLQDSRHPVVEDLLTQSEFVPNDVQFTPDQYLLLLTGPNMSGKSTYMRQVAYCFIMNQIGCFVPATRACLPLVDQIFTRIGSADDISSGESTFMVEMKETNEALRQATPHTLLLFDEIGRGTATYDGMALAEAIIKYLASRVQAMTIFSTHYHELTELEHELTCVKNIHVGASEHQGELVFLHRILEGSADKSYGVHVAKLAGLPDEVIEDSRRILSQLENKAKSIHQQCPQIAKSAVVESNDQAESQYQILKEALLAIDVNQLTPLELMNRFQEMQADLRSE